LSQPHAHPIGAANFRLETNHGATPASPIAGQGSCDLAPRLLVYHKHVIVSARLRTQFHRKAFLAPGCQHVVWTAGLPFVEALLVRPESARPVALSGIARAGKAQHIARVSAGPEDTCQRLMDRAAAFTIAVTRHDDGTGNNLCSLLAGPAHR